MLTEVQQDALAELINISYARAAGALSQLTGYRVGLEVPSVAVHPLQEVSTRLKRSLDERVTAVSQVFSGIVSGNALMVLDQSAAAILCELLLDTSPESGDWSGEWPEEHREVITELGNILLNACLGTFGNLLKVQVSFSVPLLHIDAVDTILRSTSVAGDNLSHGLMIHTRFHLRDKNVTGYLVIILGVTSLDRLVSGLDRWL
jgi:chemotaxis protein CheC